MVVGGNDGPWGVWRGSTDVQIISLDPEVPVPKCVAAKVGQLPTPFRHAEGAMMGDLISIRGL